MKIVEVNNEHIKFDNGYEITHDHDADCCEWNYADFEQLDDIALHREFSEDLIFEPHRSGFLFGNKTGGMFFVPCYSEQNGYYSDDVDILFNGEKILNVKGEFVDTN